ncbi:hypothetical protein BJ322DRAFT_1105486 [Thelephora terrestris]|uniref:DUF6535 domain-containing protein n=1 Tax=Thelephora terrestris TaxID=56493 RepID=A0A9P6LA92_9AGAM|nr:hypothetical protein BJ322DRAFT_1105486 [Thelephora terrestris]
MSGLEEIKIDSREDGSGGQENAIWEQWRSDSRSSKVDFMKQRDERLKNTITIAGLLSTMISAFIIYTLPQLQSDSTEEPATFPLMLLLGMYDTFFGGDGTRVPHWSAIPRSTIVTQALLYIGLSATLASAFLSLFANRLMSQHPSTRLWGPGIGQGQHRLRRFTLDIDVVLSTSSFLLQSAIVFFGFALSVYLWMVNFMIATLVPIVTLGILSFYASHLTAGR